VQFAMHKDVIICDIAVNAHNVQVCNCLGIGRPMGLVLLVVVG